MTAAIRLTACELTEREAAVSELILSIEAVERGSVNKLIKMSAYDLVEDHHFDDSDEAGSEEGAADLQSTGDEVDSSSADEGRRRGVQQVDYSELELAQRHRQRVRRPPSAAAGE